LTNESQPSIIKIFKKIFAKELTNVQFCATIMSRAEQSRAEQ